MTDLEKLRKEAADAGITETGEYIEWLEKQLLTAREKVNRARELMTRTRTWETS